MTWAAVLFASVAGVTVVSAVGVAVARSVVRSAVWLLFTLVGVAVTYFLLGAEFLGAAQLIVYVGGTLVLVVFGVMVTNRGPFAVLPVRRIEYVVGGLLALALLVVLVTASLGFATPAADPLPDDQPLPGVEQLGLAFLGPYLLPFEIVSVHLLVVLVAAAYLARAKRRVEAAKAHGQPSVGADAEVSP